MRPDDTAADSRNPVSGELQIVRAVLIPAVFLLIIRTKADPDLWGHTQFGLDILRHGFTTVDPYSFTSDIPWINHEWLAEVSFAAAWTAAGSFGLIALKLAVITGMFVAAWTTLRRAQVRPGWLDVLLVLLLVGTWVRTAPVRPQLYSVLLFTVLLALLRSINRETMGRLFLVPVIFAAWINLHGGWIVGFGIYAFWTAMMLLFEFRRLPAITLLVAAVLSAAALFVNPYGPAMLGFIAETVRFERSDIADWQPIYRTQLPLVLWLSTAALASYVLVGRWRSVRLYEAAIVIGVALAAIQVSRLDAFFAVATVMLLGPRLASSEARPVPARAQQRNPVAIVAAVVTSIGIIVGVTAREPVLCLRGDDAPWSPERQAGEFIRINHFEGRLLSWYNWGQYALWHFGPGLQVSMDGRRETVYSAARLEQHYALYDRPEENLRTLQEWNPDYAWLPVGTPLVQTLKTQGWQEVFVGPRSSILSRHPREFVAAASLEGPSCFPGP